MTTRWRNIKSCNAQVHKRDIGCPTLALRNIGAHLRAPGLRTESFGQESVALVKGQRWMKMLFSLLCQTFYSRDCSIGRFLMGLV